MSTLKKIGIGVAIALPVLFVLFLYLMPPLTLLPQEEFVGPTHAVQSDMSHLSDPAKRMIVERGSYLVHAVGCNDCHTPQGDTGPILEEYLSGGILLANSEAGFVSYNLTPDKETGLGERTDDEILRALRSGMFHTGRQINYRAMPWAGFSNMTEEDLRAVVAYLRELKPVRNAIPAPPVKPPLDVPKDAELFYPGNFGTK